MYGAPRAAGMAGEMTGTTSDDGAAAPRAGGGGSAC